MNWRDGAQVSVDAEWRLLVHMGERRYHRQALRAVEQTLLCVVDVLNLTADLGVFDVIPC